MSACLRYITGIPHTVQEADYNRAPKNKVPFIEHDGKLIGDSQLIIRYLENTFNVSYMSGLVGEGKQSFVPYSKLSATDKAQSEFIRILCEAELYWAILSTRWAGKEGLCRTETAWQNTVSSYFDAIPSFLRGAITAMIRVDTLRDAWGQGFSRHSPDDQLYLAKRYVMALSTALGSNTYMLGSFPTECDCSAFGTLDCLLDDSKWPNDLTDFLKKECPNLVRYHSAIRHSVFADFQPELKLPAGVSEVKAFPNQR